MYGTPWHGEGGFALPTSAPLTHIYFLQKGAKNELIPQGKAEGAARLFSCCFAPLYFPEAVSFTLAFFEDVVKAVPLRRTPVSPRQNRTQNDQIYLTKAANPSRQKPVA